MSSRHMVETAIKLYGENKVFMHFHVHVREMIVKKPHLCGGFLLLGSSLQPELL